MLEEFRNRILERKPLRIRGGGTKDFYGGPLAGDILDTRGYSGIVDYEPTELVITAKCGTPLAEIESALAARRQMLAFEPPHFSRPSPPGRGIGGEGGSIAASGGDHATIGGSIAAGLSGPRRASAGAVRDFVLGVKMLDGEGRLLTFGGQVMKNVAGYDVSRLMAGSLGTLGLIAEVSLKVLPLPAAEATLRFDLPLQGDRGALDLINRWAGRPLPVSATCWHDGQLNVRLSGARAAVVSASESLGGEKVGADEAAAFWDGLREQRHAFFAGDAALWRLSLPSTAADLALAGPTLIEWGGAQRWLRGEAADEIRTAAAQAGGHATLFRGDDELKRLAGTFQPLDPVPARIHRDLKRAFDPHGIFNRGRFYAEF